MRALLDTHAFLWWITDDDQLSSAARATIGAPDNQVFVSAASVWEIVTKSGSEGCRSPGRSMPSCRRISRPTLSNR